MKILLKQLRDMANRQGQATALSEPGRSLSWSQMLEEIDRIAVLLSPYQGKVVALYADNGIDWVLIDLAAMQAGVVLLPLPPFFSNDQQQHALITSQATAVISQQPVAAAINFLHSASTAMPITASLQLRRLSLTGQCLLPANTQKITFTSGSTGQPKGVCLSDDNQLQVAQALIARTGLTAISHLCVLPLSTLLENIAGVYAPLLSGGQIMLLPISEMGFNGGRGFAVESFLQCIHQQQPQSLILLPELLMALTAAINAGWEPPQSLQFIAVGGSRVAPTLIKLARAAGLPVFEGYGLSECSSVVSLNSVAEHRVGSVGKPLAHVGVAIENQEIMVSGNAFLGYINEPESWYPQKIATGDLGYLDDDGYLHILGRRKNLLISSFGRNINPEWVESELLSNLAITQCVVIGDAKPFCSALIQPRHADISNELIDDWVKQVNSGLPDYAQILDWQRFSRPLSLADGTLTANGRPIRKAIYHQYQQQINDFYKENA